MPLTPLAPPVKLLSGPFQYLLTATPLLQKHPSHFPLYRNVILLSTRPQNKRGKRKQLHGSGLGVWCICLLHCSLIGWLNFYLAALIEQDRKHLVLQAWLSWKQKPWKPLWLLFITMANYLEAWTPFRWNLQGQCGSHPPDETLTGRQSFSLVHDQIVEVHWRQSLGDKVLLSGSGWGVLHQIKPWEGQTGFVLLFTWHGKADYRPKDLSGPVIIWKPWEPCWAERTLISWSTLLLSNKIPVRGHITAASGKSPCSHNPKQK